MLKYFCMERIFRDNIMFVKRQNEMGEEGIHFFICYLNEHETAVLTSFEMILKNQNFMFVANINKFFPENNGVAKFDIEKNNIFFNAFSKLVNKTGNLVEFSDNSKTETSENKIAFKKDSDKIKILLRYKKRENPRVSISLTNLENDNEVGKNLVQLFSDLKQNFSENEM